MYITWNIVCFFVWFFCFVCCCCVFFVPGGNCFFFLCRAALPGAAHCSYNPALRPISYKFKAQWNRARRILLLIIVIQPRWVISACRLHGDNNLQRAVFRPLQDRGTDVSTIAVAACLLVRKRNKGICLNQGPAVQGGGGVPRKYWWHGTSAGYFKLKQS